ncbi:MAG: rod shape-determining protein RodA [Chloroflexi bacterium]|nr:FtsW/RodA/SpoVE family cell cycle protein [Anaerolineaceae bacterium]NMB90294.1 rod shape-determining protein RodA [Chloroflexota bacterium]
MRRDFWRNFDFLLFGSVIILCVFGIAMIHSAIAGSPEITGSEQRQAIFVGAGLVLILVVALIDYHYWASLTRIMYIGSLLLLLVIFIIGQARFGSARWLDTGLILIQPAELVKIVMILVLADFFSHHIGEVYDLRWVALSFLLTIGLVVWILLQPNLSTSIVIFVLWFSMLWMSGLPPKYLLLFTVLGLLAAIVAFPFLEEYQQLRVINFLFPDPTARHGNSYNVDQALITIGSGGWFGQGYGHSTQVQLRFLKVRHTDFIFSAMASEFGFIGTVLVIALLVFVILRCFRAARLAADPFGGLIAHGVATLLFFQTIVNIGVNLNVIPVTGLTLPFISYGGSSLVSLFLGIGLVESVIARHKPLSF